MQFEKQPSGGAVIASIGPAFSGPAQPSRSYRREHKIVGGGRPRFRGEGFRGEGRPEAGDVVARHRSPSLDVMSGGAAGMVAISTPSGYRHLAGATMLVVRGAPAGARLESELDAWLGSLRTAMSWLAKQVIEGFALSAAVTHSEFLWPLVDDAAEDRLEDRHQDDRRHVRTNQPLAPSSEPGHAPGHAVVSHHPLFRVQQIQPAVDGPAVGASAGRPSGSDANWRQWTISILAGLRSRVLRRRNVNRIRTDWQAIDDRTLKDIGLSRYEVGLIVEDLQHWD
jgi:hypothetical protein